MAKLFKKMLKPVVILIPLTFFILILWETYQADRLGFDSKELWDWMELLIVPMALASASIWFAYTQKNTEQKIARQARKLDQDIAIERQRQQTLENYLDRMAELLLDRGLSKENTDVEVTNLATALTLTVLREMEGKRNKRIIQLLNDSNLLGDISILKGADLRGVDLSGSDFTYANLTKADLRETNLQETILYCTNLNDANLDKANLRGADLDHAKLRDAKLRDATLIDTILRDAKLRGAKLSGSNLERADLGYADLHNADLCNAKLRNADLDNTKLDGANLKGANLGGYVLIEESISPADFSRLISPDDSPIYARSLKKTILPNGQQYEEWCSKNQQEKREEDGIERAKTGA